MRTRLKAWTEKNKILFVSNQYFQTIALWGGISPEGDPNIKDYSILTNDSSFEWYECPELNSIRFEMVLEISISPRGN